MVDFKAVAIEPRLPFSWGGGHGADHAALFLTLKDAHVVAIGAPDVPNGAIEGGGLAIDFVAKGEAAVRRVVFAFNETGMWVEFDSSTSNP